MSRIALALLLICSCLTSHAETAPLRVGITEVPPFVIKHDDGSWSGISIDLWNAIAEKNGYAFQYEAMPFDRLLDSLEQSKVDVVVGAMTMTPEREARFDFTHPFYFTGLAIAVPATASAVIGFALGGFAVVAPTPFAATPTAAPASAAVGMALGPFLQLGGPSFPDGQPPPRGDGKGEGDLIAQAGGDSHFQFVLLDVQPR